MRKCCPCQVLSMPSVVPAKQCSAEFNSSQKYCTKFESKKQTDSKKFRPKGHRNMKRKVKIYIITGVGISDDGLT